MWRFAPAAFLQCQGAKTELDVRPVVLFSLLSGAMIWNHIKTTTMMMMMSSPSRRTGIIFLDRGRQCGPQIPKFIDPSMSIGPASKTPLSPSSQHGGFPVSLSASTEYFPSSACPPNHRTWHVIVEVNEPMAVNPSPFPFIVVLFSLTRPTCIWTSASEAVVQQIGGCGLRRSDCFLH